MVCTATAARFSENRNQLGSGRALMVPETKRPTRRLVCRTAIWAMGGAGDLTSAGVFERRRLRSMAVGSQGGIVRRYSRHCRAIGGSPTRDSTSAQPCDRDWLGSAGGSRRAPPSDPDQRWQLETRSDAMMKSDRSRTRSKIHQCRSLRRLLVDDCRGGSGSRTEPNTEVFGQASVSESESGVPPALRRAGLGHAETTRACRPEEILRGGHYSERARGDRGRATRAL